jgi:hypothetical protein
MGETQKPALRKMPKGQNGMPRHKAFSAEMIDSCTPAPARPEHVKKMSPRQPHTKDGDQGQIEATFSKAISIAKDQGSISLRLRAETSKSEFRRYGASCGRSK